MFKIIVIVPLVALCLAAPHPTSDQNPTIKSEPLLPRPSPINPDIPSDPKPEEKITLITDPQHKWQAEHDKMGTISGAINLNNPKVEKQQKRQVEQDPKSQEECHDHEKDEIANVPLPITSGSQDQKEKGVKRDTTSTDISKHNPEVFKSPNPQPDQSHPCTNEGCQDTEDHINHKRETRTTESPVNQNKPKTKPYVAIKPEPTAEKVKRDNEKKDPMAKPQPEQPDEGDKKKDKIPVPKVDTPTFLKPQAKTEDPKSQKGSKP